ncbi:PAP2 superfamily domain-containing protein [Ditylenchus destructor]|uniref:PAP2 superfamily domain-containing protein n=1 Tax=Ditylenchus destructor TaxID=166010 RepID=A0AAD4N2F6_9BILA|nr:PAP2 superfamily domain-containing protein [Ditylenchus destructor]
MADAESQIPCATRNVSSTGTDTFTSKRLPVVRVLLDFAILTFTWLGLETISRYIGPYERGIFCDDESIRLPYRTGTVSGTALFAFCFVVPAIAIVATEAYRLFKSSTSDEHFLEYERGRPFHYRLGIRFLFFQGYFFMAFVVTMIFTIITKFPVGRLRPHFLDVCKPNINLTNCAEYGNQYITSFECTTHNQHLVMEARLSFFSGHSSLSLCATTFTVLYLQSRLHGHLGSKVILILLQAFVLSSGMFIAYSRVFDHMHHSSDVLIGMIVGILTAVTVALGIAKFEMPSPRRCKNAYGHATDPSKYRPATVSNGSATDIP